MSVAFRRDSDEEHLEPKFQLPLPPGPNLVTSRGLELIRVQIAELESRLCQSTDEAVLEPIRRELRYWLTRQSTAQLAPISVGDKVEFGARVTFLQTGKMMTFRMVGHDEADPPAGLISFAAPLSRAMLAAEVGEVVPFGGVEEAIEILEITVSGTAR